MQKRLVAFASARGARWRPLVVAAAAAAAAVPAAATSKNHALPFKRPDSAGSPVLLSFDDQAPAPFVAPPPTGLACPPLIVRVAPTAYSAGSGDGWLARGGFINLNAAVAPSFAGLKRAQWQEVATTHLADHIAALTSAVHTLAPASAAHMLRRLAAAHGPALALVAPGGTSALAALPGCTLPALLQRAAACAAELAAGGSPVAAVDTALAALQLASCLRFGSRRAAEPFHAATLALKAALCTATAAPAAAISEQHVLALMAVCARADRHLWLAPWAGNRWSAASDALLSSGWGSGEAAVQYAESWCALVARGRLQFAATKFQAMAEAALGHRQLTAGQLDRLRAAEAALPAESSTQLNAWLVGWTAEVGRRRAALVRAQARQATATATATVRARLAAAHAATAAVELAQGAPALAAFA